MSNGLANKMRNKDYKKLYFEARDAKVRLYMLNQEMGYMMNELIDELKKKGLTDDDINELEKKSQEKLKKKLEEKGQNENRTGV